MNIVIVNINIPTNSIETALCVLAVCEMNMSLITFGTLAKNKWGTMTVSFHLVLCVIRHARKLKVYLSECMP